MKAKIVLAVKMWTRHKKKILTLLLSVSFATFVMMLSDYSITEAINASYETEASQRGAHHLAIFDLSEQQVEKLDSLSGISIGYTQTTPCMINGYGKMMCVGSIDTSFTQIGRIELVEGHFPQSQCEVIIEENLANRLGLKVQDTIQLETSSGSGFFKLVGILKDYTGHWDAWDAGEDESKMFPQIVWHNEMSTSFKHAIIQFDGALTDDHFHDIGNLTHKIGSNNFIWNSRMYTSQTHSEIVNLTMLKWIVILCMSLALLLFSTSLEELYITSVLPSIRIMCQIGKSSRFCKSILILQYVGMLLLTAMGNIAISSILKVSLHAAKPHFGMIIIATTLFAVSCSITYIRFCKQLDTQKCDQTRRYQSYHSHRCISLMIGLNNLTIEYRNFIGIIIALAVCIAVFCFGIQYKNELSISTDLDVAFELFAPNPISSIDYEGFEMLLNADDCIPWDMYDNICTNPNIEIVKGEVQTYQSKIRIERELFDAVFIACTPTEYEMLQANYPAFAEQNSSYHSFFTLVMPEGMHVEQNATADILYMRYVGKNIDGYVGQLVEHEVILKNVVKNMSFVDIGGEQLVVTTPIIFASVPTLRSWDIFPGFSKLSIWALPDADLKLLKKDIERSIAPVLNSDLFCVNEYYERYRQLGDYIQSMTSLCCIILGGYVMAMSVITFYVRLLVNKRTIGTFRILGCSKKNMTNGILIENSIYLCCAAAIGGAGLIILSIFSGWGLYFVKYVLYWLRITLIMLIAGGCLVYVVSSKMLNKDIARLIDHDE